MDKDQKILDLETKLQALQIKYDALKQASPASINNNKVWEDVKSMTNFKLYDNDAIKQMIKNKAFTMSDIGKRYGRTLLHQASYNGNFELAKLCINMGADLKKRMTSRGNDSLEEALGNTPIEEAKHWSNYHVEQLLLLSEIKGNIGERVKGKAYDLNRQNGIVSNAMSVLSTMPQTKEIFTKALREIMMHSMTEKKIFDDVMLSLYFALFEEGEEEKEAVHTEDTELFQTIMKTSTNIIAGRDKRDWFWMKEVLIPSNVKKLTKVFFAANMRIIWIFRFGSSTERIESFFITNCCKLSRKNQRDKSRN